MPVDPRTQSSVASSLILTILTKQWICRSAASDGIQLVDEIACHQVLDYTVSDSISAG